jgi:hypothetical protein
MRYRLFLIVFAATCMGCASSYRQINPYRVLYQDSVASYGAALEYKYDVLRKAGNKKYARKADDKGIKIVAIQFTNLTDVEINFSRDVEILADGEQITPLLPEVVRREVKQVSGLYMLWSLLWVTISKCENDDCSVTPIPVGLLIGIGNTIGASAANRNFHQELEYHNLMNKTVAPGASVKGLLILRTTDEKSLEVRLKEFKLIHYQSILTFLHDGEVTGKTRR